MRVVIISLLLGAAALVANADQVPHIDKFKIIEPDVWSKNAPVCYTVGADPQICAHVQDMGEVVLAGANANQEMLQKLSDGAHATVNGYKRLVIRFFSVGDDKNGGQHFIVQAFFNFMLNTDSFYVFGDYSTQNNSVVPTGYADTGISMYGVRSSDDDQALIRVASEVSNIYLQYPAVTMPSRP